MAVSSLLMLLGVAGITQAQDDNTDTGPYGDLTLLENGDLIEDQLSEDSNAHLYSFYASTGDMVAISMTQLADETSLDPYLILMSASGEVLAVDDDGGGEPFLSAQIDRVEIPEDGLYLILATEAVGLRFDLLEGHSDNEAIVDDDLSYELEVYGINQPESVENLSVDAVEMIPGDTVTLELDSDQPVGFVLLEGQEGDTVSLETAPANGDDVDTLLYLFDPVGTRVAINDDGEGIGLYSRIDGYELAMDGQHLVMITAYGYQHTEPDAETPEEWSGGGMVELLID